MKLPLITALCLCVLPSLPAREIRMTPQTELKPLLKTVAPGDALVLANGEWRDVELRFESLPGTAAQPIRIRAESPGKTVFTGASIFGVSGSNVIVSGFTFRNPQGVSDVFQLRTHSSRHAHHSRVTDCVFEQTEGSRTDKESRWLNVYGTHNRIDRCFFAGKRNKGTTLVVWVGETPGKHRLDRNHFGPRPELGRNGGETIRIGTSDVSERDCDTVVESNYFERCDGEAEIISNKSCGNVYRDNLFDRCGGALTLRHGHRCVVEGNVFLGGTLKGTGGVRIIGRGHHVTDNYFEGLRGDGERAAICFMNGIPDGPLSGYAPVRDALVAGNWFIDCKVSMEFGVRASSKVSVRPANCRILGNAFLPGKWELFRVTAEPLNFTWRDNSYQTGKTRGADLVEIERVDMPLQRGTDGLLRPVDSNAPPRVLPSPANTGPKWRR